MIRPNATKPVVQGHRGCRAAWPENTLAGFRAAIRDGADAIELDVALTGDGIVVVCHDPALDPDLTRGPDGAWIAAPGPVIFHSTLAELRAHDVGRARPGGATATQFPAQTPVDGARIPTLAEVFAATEAAGFTVDVELKTDPTQPGIAPKPDILADAVMAVAQAAGARARLALRSFDWRGLEHVRRCWPDIPLTWLSDAETEGQPGWRGTTVGQPPGSLAAFRPSTWAPDHRGLERAAIERAHAMGIAVMPWTVNRPEDVARLVRWGVDGICTDDVKMARQLIDKLWEGDRPGAASRSAG